MKKLLLAVCILFSLGVFAQDVVFPKDWKFKTGDDTGWALAAYNDADWTAIHTGEAWEGQGYPNYDGFAWYRLHIVIPSSIKEKSFLKDKIRFDLGKIDDGDEVYLNGSLIGKNGGKNNDIHIGTYDVQRAYLLSFSDPRILWDKENIIAVRVYDSGGNGGMYDGKYGISVMDVTDYVVINNSDPFRFTGDKNVSKKIILQSTSEKYDFTGKLRINITDLETGAIVAKQTLGVDFAKSRPFEYNFKTTLPENKSYGASYIFEENRTKKEITLTEGVPYILTPKPGALPKINGATVFGVRPGAPFLYKIPATGDKPIAYEVTGLPKGLTLEKQTGIITGTIDAKGDYKLKFTAKNKSGVATKNFTVTCGDNIALTPVMGWNSWNCWALAVSDEKVKISAKTMADKLADYGWAYINIDDGWEDIRNSDGEIVPNKKFPDMKSLTGFVHGLGLKMGIYSSPGTQTCGGYLGSYQHEEQDAKTYGAWGIDYLKYDWCSYEKIAPPQPSLEDYKKPYELMRGALNKINRDIVFSFCQYGMGDVWKWGAETGGNSWRTTGDINDSWGSLSGIGFSQDKGAAYAQPGHFNDPDMLVVGKVGWGPNLHTTKLSPDEQYTHISLWCLLESPLLIGCDMAQLDDFTLNLLTNSEVLAIDQDALGKSARKVFENGQIQVWLKSLQDGSEAFGIFNLGDKTEKATIKFADLKLAEQLKLRDLWRQKDLGVFKNSFSIAVPSHGVVLLKSRAIVEK